MSTVLAETWMTYTPVCSWEVVADELCNSINVPININMATLNLQGTLAPELGMLSDSLRFLELTANNIQGTVPTELGHLTRLVRLRLHDNRLTGTIPTEIGNMKNLGTFYESMIVVLHLPHSNFCRTLTRLYRVTSHRKKSTGRGDSR